MIGFLHGKIIKKSPPQLLLEVHGVGYEIEAPMTTFYVLPEIGEDIDIYTHLIVREDAHLLFGFATEDERHLFRTLIKVNGVGAKMGLTILSGIEVDVFKKCIQDDDSIRLTKLPGVGKKTAERLIVEMRDKLKDLPVNIQANNKLENSSDLVDEAVSALISLGYKPQEASRYVLDIDNEGMNCETLIREALKNSVKK